MLTAAVATMLLTSGNIGPRVPDPPTGDHATAPLVCTTSPLVRNATVERPPSPPAGGVRNQPLAIRAASPVRLQASRVRPRPRPP